MNHYAFHRRFPFATCRTSFPVTSQSEDRLRPQGRFARSPTMALAAHQDVDSFRKTGLYGQRARPPRFPVTPHPRLRGASRRDAASAFLVTLLIEMQM